MNLQMRTDVNHGNVPNVAAFCPRAQFVLDRIPLIKAPQAQIADTESESTTDSERETLLRETITVFTSTFVSDWSTRT